MRVVVASPAGGQHGAKFADELRGGAPAERDQPLCGRVATRSNEATRRREGGLKQLFGFQLVFSALMLPIYAYILACAQLIGSPRLAAPPAVPAA